MADTALELGRWRSPPPLWRPKRPTVLAKKKCGGNLEMLVTYLPLPRMRIQVSEPLFGTFRLNSLTRPIGKPFCRDAGRVSNLCRFWKLVLVFWEFVTWSDLPQILENVCW